MKGRIREYISVVVAIFARDLKRIIKNPVALLLVLGACALPSAYAWYCTAANWDPYQSTEGIRIAVANDDTGADAAEVGRIDIGDEVVEKLKDNHELGWAFYDDSDAAANSVYSGESYAAIVIPADFSEDFASILTGDFKQPQIDYYLNEKISAAAPDFTNEGMDVVQNEINENFVETVTDTVLGITQKLGLYAEDKAGNAENSLVAGVRKATDALSSTRESLDAAGPSIDELQSAAQSADSTLASLQGSIPELESKLADARKALENARASASQYESKLESALSSSAASLGKAAATAQTELARVSAELTQAYGESSAALAQAKSITAQNDTLITSLENSSTSSPALTAAIEQLRRANDDMKATVSSLQQANDAMHSTLEGITGVLQTLDDQAKAASEAMSQASKQLRDEAAPAMNKALDGFADTLGAFSGLVIAMEPAVDQARASLSGLDEALDQARKAAESADGSLAAIQKRLGNTLTDLRALEGSSTVKALDAYLKIDPSDAAAFISSPVTLETIDVYPVRNYGSGVVSFFTSVALWVAGFVFIDLFKMRVDPAGLPEFTERQAYFGRWLLFMFLGLIPPIIVCTGDLLMGIQCVSPPAFVFAGLVSGLVYVNLIYALAQAFRYIGKGIAVLLLIVQIPGSSGLYPVEMMPGFYQALHPLLPFTYTIDAFRSAVGGFYGADYWIDLAVLVCVFVPVGFLIGLVLGRWASNLTLLLDKEIGRTQLFEGEYVSKREQLRKSTLLRVVLRDPEYSERLKERYSRYKLTFPRLRRIGWIALVAQFAITFAVMVLVQADVNTKLFLLLAMVIGIVLVDSYLITIVYMKASLPDKISLLDMPDDELAEKVSAR